jgi:hypothetical protein
VVAAVVVEDVVTVVKLVSMDDCCSAGTVVILLTITMGVDDRIFADVEPASEDIFVLSDVITPCVVASDTNRVEPTDVSLADMSAEFVVACELIVAIIVDVIAPDAPVLTSTNVSLAEVRAASEDVASFGATVVMPLDVSSSAVDLSSVDVCVDVVDMTTVLASF